MLENLSCVLCSSVYSYGVVLGNHGELSNNKDHQRMMVDPMFMIV